MWLRVALVAATVICSLLGAYALYDRNIAETTVRRHLRDLKERQQLPAEFRDVDIDTFDLSNYDIQLPGPVMFRQDLAYFLAACWYLWVPVVVVACLGVAWLAHLLFKVA